MKRLNTAILATTLFSGCSAFDYLQYRENTGLMVVEKPDGYGSARFGEVIAVSQTDETDLMAVSAGRGNKTLIYKLAEAGKLDKLENPTDQYPASSDMEARNPEVTGSGVSLAGLPSWTDKFGHRVEGCFAVGEPEANQVTVSCASDSENYLNLPAPKADELPKVKSFGQLMASVPSESGGQWLLAVAGTSTFGLFSSTNTNLGSGRSDLPLRPFPAGESIGGLAAGRIQVPAIEGTSTVVYLAVGTVNADTHRYGVHIFLQAEEHATELKEIECLDSTEPGFGGAMTTGDLDGDGQDELVVSAGSIKGRRNKVYIYDGLSLQSRYIEERADQGEPVTCTGTLQPVATITPTAGEFDVECGADCGFGLALAVGDIATDDSGPELVVGARDAEVEGESQAGAVYIYRGWARGAFAGSGAGAGMFDRFKLAGQVFDSTPKGGDSFGASVAIAPMAGRNELLIGASGTGKVVVAFCTGVGEDIEAGGDVTRNGDGKVVSTRCRL